MKILLVADLHYTLQQWDWLSQSAEAFDMVVVAGDLLDIVSIVDLDVQILVVTKYLRRINDSTRLVVSSGNHDLDDENAAGEKVAAWMEEVRDLGILSDGEGFDADDIRFTICPWWDGPVSRDLVADQLKREAELPKHRWIWVYHAPPDASPVSWTGKTHFGDAFLRGEIERYSPWLVLSGHVHHAPFANGGSWVDRVGDTWVFNMGKQIGPIPAHIVIDTKEDRADWRSLSGNEAVDLDRPLEGQPVEV